MTQEGGPQVDEDRIRVLIVDDHLTFAEALGLALNLEEAFEVLPPAGTASAAIDAVMREHPDVVIMDVHLPDGDGVETTRRILALDPSVRIIILSGFLDVEALSDAATAGAAAFLLKEEPVQRVIDAIRPAVDGSITINRGMLEGLLNRLAAKTEATTNGAGQRLTAREAEVLTLLSQGVDAQAIARKLGISVNTSRSHVKSMMAKLGAHSQLEAVAVATRSGLISR
jgi:DNA-binding NarL/FixJ family response regulator